MFKIILFASVLAISSLFANGKMASEPKNLLIKGSDGWSDIRLKDQYLVNDEFEIPACSYGDGSSKVISSLIFPDGTSKSNNAKIALDQYGLYKLSYSTQIGGEVKNNEVEFTVYNTLYSYSSSKSSVQYERYSDFDDVDFEYKPIGEISAPKEGLRLKIAKGDVVNFNNIFDLSQTTSLNKLVKGFMTPSTIGIADCDYTFFRFTDAEDPSVYLTYALARVTASSNWYCKCYFKVCANNQSEFVGIEQGTPEKVKKGLTEWGGTYISTSFVAEMNGNSPYEYTGTVKTCDPSACQFIIGYDSSLNTAYAANNNFSYNNNDFKPYKIEKLDSTDFSAMWYGFPSKKAKLSVYMDGYSGDIASCMITEMMGVDLTKNLLDTSEEVNINTDCEYDPFDMPDGVIGCPYTLSSSTATSYGKNRNVNVEVEYNYKANPINVEVVDNKFIPKSAGDYRICYSATDVYGNLTNEFYFVDVPTSNLHPIVIDLDGSLVEAKLGEVYKGKSFDISGGNGLVNVIKTATNGEDVIDFTSTGSFIPTKLGQWTVTYKGIDYAGASQSASYIVNVVPNDNIVIAYDPTLPLYFLSGNSYVTPVVYADDWTSGTLVQRECNLTITDSNGTKEVKPGDSFSPYVTNNNEKVLLKYYYGTVSKTYEVSTIKAYSENSGVKTLEAVNYFVGASEYASLDKSNYRIKIVNDHEKDDISWTYAKELCADGLSFELSNIPGNSNISDFAIKVIDYEDPSLSLTVTLDILTTGDVFECCSRKITGAAADTFNNQNSKTVSFEYNSKAFAYNGSKIEVTNYDDGRTFQGFPSDKVYLEVTAHNVEKNNGYSVSKMLNSTFSKYDSVGPKATINGSVSGFYEKGSKIVIPTATAVDLFAAESSISLTVKCNNKVVKDEDGVSLENIACNQERTIFLTEYGNYSIEYISTEVGWVFSNKTTNLYYIVCIDGKAPVIVCEDSLPKNEIKVGSSIIVPQFVAYDNVSSHDKIRKFVTMITPHGLAKTVEQKQKIALTEKGIYTFRFTAVDEQGNIAVVTKTVRTIAA